MIATLLCSLALTSATPPPEATPAQATWQALLDHYSGADALVLDAHMQLDGDDTPYRVQLSLARKFQGTGSMTRGEEHVRFIGDGKALYVLNDFQETYMRMVEGYGDLPVAGYLSPLVAWAGGGAPQPKSLTLVESTPANPLVRVLRAEFPGKTETYWITPGNQLQAATLDMAAPHGRFLGHVSFSRAEALRGVKGADFRGALPPSHSLVLGAQELLLPPGTPAPDVEFLALDGKSVSLDEYLGKTVILSFWFYT